jgi:4-hydroxybutyrate CoA-transferase
MSWQDIYNSRKCSAKEAVSLIKSGDRVVFAHGLGEPPALIEAMVDNAAAYRDVEIMHMISFGTGAYSRKEYKENFRFNGLFTSANTRQSIVEGHGDFTPAYFHEVPLLFRRGLIPIDVFMVQASPPDKHGYCNTGVAADYTMQGIESAKLVLVQINDQCPVTYGDTFVHVSKIDRFVEASEPVKEIFPTEIDGDAEKIAGFCVPLIEDRSTLQIGIGAIPDAIVKGLKGKKHLGIHSEMITDALLDLYETGAITNEAKSIDRGKMIVTFLLGTQRLYDFADHNPSCGRWIM